MSNIESREDRIEKFTDNIIEKHGFDRAEIWIPNLINGIVSFCLEEIENYGGKSL